MNFNYSAITIKLSNLKTNKISIFTKMNSYSKILIDNFSPLKTMLFKPSISNIHYKALIKAFLMKNGKSKTMQSSSYKAVRSINEGYSQLGFASVPKTIFESYASPFNYTVKKSLYNKRKSLEIPKWFSSSKEQKIIFSFLKDLLRVSSKRSLPQSLHANIFILASHKSKLAELQREKQQQSTDLWTRNSISFKNQKSAGKSHEALLRNSFPDFYTSKSLLKDYGKLKNVNLVPGETGYKRSILFDKSLQKSIAGDLGIKFSTLQKHYLDINLTYSSESKKYRFFTQKEFYFDPISWFNSKKANNLKEPTLEKRKHYDNAPLIDVDGPKQKVRHVPVGLKVPHFEKDLLTKLRFKIDQELNNPGFFPLSDRVHRMTGLDFLSSNEGKKYSWILEKKLLNRLLSSALRKHKIDLTSNKKGKYALLRNRRNSLRLSVRSLDSLAFLDSIQKYRKYSNYPRRSFFINQRTRKFISLKHTSVLKNRIFNTSKIAGTSSTRLLLFNLKSEHNTTFLKVRFELTSWKSTGFHHFVPHLKQRLNNLKIQGCFKVLEKPTHQKIKRSTLLRSPHVNKKSQQHFAKVEYIKSLIVICEMKQALPFEKLNMERIKVLISLIIRQTAGFKLKVSFT